MGTSRNMAPFPFWWIKGLPGFSGPMMTDTGLIFSGVSNEHKLRAFDLNNGAELWQAELPTAANAVPMTYQVQASGKQYVVSRPVVTGAEVARRVTTSLLLPCPIYINEDPSL